MNRDRPEESQRDEPRGGVRLRLACFAYQDRKVRKLAQTYSPEVRIVKGNPLLIPPLRIASRKPSSRAAKKTLGSGKVGTQLPQDRRGSRRGPVFSSLVISPDTLLGPAALLRPGRDTNHANVGQDKSRYGDMHLIVTRLKVPALMCIGPFGVMSVTPSLINYKSLIY